MSSPVYCCLLVYTKTDFRKKKKSKTRKILTNRWSNIFVLYLTESQTNRDFRGESVAKEASVSTKQPSLPSCCQRKREPFCFCAFTICDSKTFETPPFLKNQCIKRENIVHNFLKKFLKKTTKLKWTFQKKIEEKRSAVESRYATLQPGEDSSIDWAPPLCWDSFMSNQSFPIAALMYLI